MTRTKAFKAAAVAAGLAVAAAMSGCEASDLPLPGHPVDADHSIEITVTFEDVLNLNPRSVVMVNDVAVGEVTDLRAEGWSAVATLRLRDDLDLPGNVVAEIRQSSILGEKYVALEQPYAEQPSGQLADGAHLDLDKSGRNPELEEVLSAVGFLLNGGGVAQLQTITSEVNTALDGRQDDVRAVLRRVTELVTSLDQQKTEIIGAMESVRNLSATLNKEKKSITAALDSFGPAVDTLREQHDKLIEALGSLRNLSDVSVKVVNGVTADLLSDLRLLQPTLHELNRVGSHLPAAVGMLVSFPWTYDADRVEKGDYGNVAAIASIDLDLLLKRNGIVNLDGLTDLLKSVGGLVPGLGTLLGLPGGGGS